MGFDGSWLIRRPRRPVLTIQLIQQRNKKPKTYRLPFTTGDSIGPPAGGSPAYGSPPPWRESRIFDHRFSCIFHLFSCIFHRFWVIDFSRPVPAPPPRPAPARKAGGRGGAGKIDFWKILKIFSKKFGVKNLSKMVENKWKMYENRWKMALYGPIWPENSFYGTILDEKLSDRYLFSRGSICAWSR